MHWSIWQANKRAETHADDKAHPDREDAGGRQVKPVLHQVQSAQHQHRVDEHEQISGYHFNAIKKDRLRTDIVEAEKKKKESNITHVSFYLPYQKIRTSNLSKKVKAFLVLFATNVQFRGPYTYSHHKVTKCKF